MNPEIWTLVDNEEIKGLLQSLAIEEGLRLIHCVDLSAALNFTEPEGGVILAIDSSEKYENYLTVLRRFDKNFINYEVIVFGREKTIDEIEADIDSGVDLYISQPPESTEEFLLRASHLVALRRIKSSSGMVGRSRPLNEVIETVLQVAPTEVSVLIMGESGSGKELIAKALHLRSNRRSKNFEAINCGAMAETLLESELFGHEKGSFTGAMAKRQGLFERADKGTLFLDEVGEMSLRMQVKFLRVLETGEYYRVGGNERLNTDLRVIAATNRELESDVGSGEFRKDLYYRLKVVQITIPPLRARQDDIDLLARHFIKISMKKHGKEIRGMEKGCVKLLQNYTWPGNIRELANIMDNMVVLSRTGMITYADLGKRLDEKRPAQSFPDLPIHVQRTREEMEREIILNSLLSLHTDVKEILGILKDNGVSVSGRLRNWYEVEEAGSEKGKDLDEIEKEAIREALIRYNGNRKMTARQLGLSERTLYRRLKEYGLG
ncbi:MAG: sigma-54-dependent Fis family transcriptional regulator [Candidatus Krumholzibacteriota bacterium]|nr:sigma-54-dependent Fis family transcriptional regulator [Candidatus Krumholzibacteriota bacterium]